MTTYTLTTTIDRDMGAHPATGLRITELHTIETSHPILEDVDGDEVRAFVGRLHAARVRLESLRAEDRERVLDLLDGEDVTADLEAEYIERMCDAVERGTDALGTLDYGLIYGREGADYPDVVESGAYPSADAARAAIDVELAQRMGGVMIVADWSRSDGESITTGGGYVYDVIDVSPRDEDMSMTNSKTENRSDAIAEVIAQAISMLPMPMYGAAARGDPAGARAEGEIRDLLERAHSLLAYSPTTRAAIDRDLTEGEEPLSTHPVTRDDH